MKKILTIIAISLFFFSCNSGSKDTDEIKQVSLDKVAVSAEELQGELISINGMVTHVCREGGQKMFITDESKEINMLVRVSESIPEFDIALEGSNVQVTGKLIVTITESTAEGEHMGEMSGMEKEECATENAMKEQGSGEVCKTNISYHLEATSFKEII